MKTLHLNLHKHWFVMTLEKVKMEDYRAINSYWFKRLVFDYKKVYKYYTGFDWNWLIKEKQDKKVLEICKTKNIGFKPFDTNTLSNGYSKTRPQFEMEHRCITVSTGKKEWGAESDKLYFVIKHGDLLSQSNCG